MSNEQVRFITRHSGKPTSGRFVYKSRGGWYWQCDLHAEDTPLPDQFGPDVPTYLEAFAGALAHAAVCPFRSAQARSSSSTTEFKEL